MRGLLRQLLLLATVPSTLFAQRADIAIVNGRVMDPASGLDAVRTVAIRDGHVVSITEGAVEADRMIDASGLVVGPGFVDILTRIRPAHETQRYKIKDGVTTAISMHGGPVDIGGWYDAFEADGALVNYGTTVGHPDVREAAGVTDPYVPAAGEQRAEMKRIAAEAIAAGAVGIGFGINYTPGASYEEIVDMFAVAAEHDVPAHVHSRYKGSVFPETIVQSVQEVIAAAAITGASAQIVHLASSAIGSTEACLEMIEGARRNGVDVMADIHPYLANSTQLESALYDPGWEERFGGAAAGSHHRHVLHPEGRDADGADAPARDDHQRRRDRERQRTSARCRHVHARAGAAHQGRAAPHPHASTGEDDDHAGAAHRASGAVDAAPRPVAARGVRGHHDLRPQHGHRSGHVRELGAVLGGRALRAGQWHGCAR
jgi:N-acyl-D-aspartate/D-glutamate deacylase